MPTECTAQAVLFQEAVDGRHVVARFDGGTLTSDGGALLLRETDHRIGLLSRFAACFADHRDPARVTHSVGALVRQRVHGLAAGYEDLNDHEQLRHDPVFAVLAEAANLTAPLAGKSTLDRLELTPAVVGPGERYKKITVDHAAVDRLLVTLFLEAHATPPAEIVLDLDDTDDPVHGAQEGRFFHGYYDEYCYLPLYIFAGGHLLGARLRPGNSYTAAGALSEVERIVTQIRAAWPTVRITLRADSGFCGDALFTWCEANEVDYVIGLAKNARLLRAIGAELAAVAATGQATRQFAALHPHSPNARRAPGALLTARPMLLVLPPPIIARGRVPSLAQLGDGPEPRILTPLRGRARRYCVVMRPRRAPVRLFRLPDAP